MSGKHGDGGRCFAFLTGFREFIDQLTDGLLISVDDPLDSIVIARFRQNGPPAGEANETSVQCSRGEMLDEEPGEGQGKRNAPSCSPRRLDGLPSIDLSQMPALMPLFPSKASLSARPAP